MQERMDEENKLNRRFIGRDELVKFKAREQELLKFREQIQQQEKQLDEYRTRLKAEQFAREKEIQKALEAREKFFAERDKELFERQREFEERMVRQKREFDTFRAKQEQSLISRETQLIESQQLLEKEKERYNEESRNNIELKSKNYVKDTLDTLTLKEAKFHKISRIWSVIGAGSLMLGLCFFGYISVATFYVIPNPVTWEFITFSVFKGIIAVAFFGALAKYSFFFSNSYMHESLKNADRRHAINFGKFYLESYGAAADWGQIKEAFEHWNISSNNAFSNSEASKLDISGFEKFASIAERFAHK